MLGLNHVACFLHQGHDLHALLHNFKHIQNFGALFPLSSWNGPGSLSDPESFQKGLFMAL